MASKEQHLNPPASGGDSTMAGMTCLVTGATSGIGEQTAHGLARLGATVLIVARDADRGAAVAADIHAAAPHATVELFLADLQVQAQVRTLAADVAGRHPRLDVLVGTTEGLCSNEGSAGDCFAPRPPASLGWRWACTSYPKPEWCRGHGLL